MYTSSDQTTSGQALIDRIAELEKQIGQEAYSTPLVLRAIQDIRQDVQAMSTLLDQTRVLLRLSSFIDISMQLDDALEAIIDAALRLLKAERGYIMLYEPDKDELKVRVARKWNFATLPEADVAFSKHVTRLALNQQLPVVTTNTGSIQQSGARSIVCAPLRLHGTTFGVLYVDAQVSQSYIGPGVLPVLGLLSHQASIAIENALLYEKMKRRAAELEEHVANHNAELSRSAERVEAIFNTSTDAIVLARADGTIRQTNPAFDDMFGYEIDEAFGCSLKDLVAPDQVSLLEYMQQSVVENRSPERVELLAQRKNHSTFNADFAISSVALNNKPDIVCSIRDISQQKRVEESLRIALEKERELGELKSRFVSMASHDIRTPLATIQTTAESLRNYSDRMDEEQKNKRFDKIHAQIKHMIELLDDVLVIGRSEAGEIEFNPSMFDLPQLCAGIIEELGSVNGVAEHLHYTYAGDDTRFWADEKLIRQIMTNLVSNAIKYSPKGSPVHVSLEHQGDRFVLQVTDQGIGIPEKDKEHLFNSFQRGTNVGSISGTGLGLAITKSAITAHGGTITFESKAGVGTTFAVTIPQCKEE